MTRLGVADFGKGITIACIPRLDPSHPEDSECGFVNEGLSDLEIDRCSCDSVPHE